MRVRFRTFKQLYYFSGIFWMSFKDFSYHFYFEVCNYKCIEPKSTTVRGEWAAGRCVHYCEQQHA
eukprot:SAG31_NODE_703_length_12720_cov_10.185088_11_plen_65_part_00